LVIVWINLASNRVWVRGYNVAIITLIKRGDKSQFSPIC
jgi:hypothetical protein